MVVKAEGTLFAVDVVGVELGIKLLLLLKLDSVKNDDEEEEEDVVWVKNDFLHSCCAVS